MSGHFFFFFVCALLRTHGINSVTHAPTHFSLFLCFWLTTGYQIEYSCVSSLRLITLRPQTLWSSFFCFTHAENPIVQCVELAMQTLFKYICIFKLGRGQGGVWHSYMCAQFHVDWDVPTKSAWIQAHAHFDTSDFFCADASFWILAHAMFQSEIHASLCTWGPWWCDWCGGQILAYCRRWFLGYWHVMRETECSYRIWGRSCDWLWCGMRGQWWLYLICHCSVVDSLFASMI